MAGKPKRIPYGIADYYLTRSELQKYASDARLTKLQGKVAIKLLVLVYHGWELIYRAEVPASPGNH